MLAKTVVFLLTCTIFLPPLFGQQINPQQEARRERNRELNKVKSDKKLDLDVQYFERTNDALVPSPRLIEQAFDSAADSLSYRVGPGDQLLVSFNGILEDQFLTEISADGHLIIPSVAEVQVDGKSLAETNATVNEKISGVLKNSTVTIRLLKMRKIRIFVIGEVENPGTFYLRGIDRLSDSIELAGDLQRTGDLTKVEIRHQEWRHHNG